MAMDADNANGFAETTSLKDWWAHAKAPMTSTIPRGVKLHVSGLSASDSALPPVGVPGHVLMQAVYNLVQNAVYAMTSHAISDKSSPPTPHARTGGNVCITAELAPATMEHPAGLVLLTVKDDGPGMSRRNLARCTEPFSTTKPAHFNSGLGLFIIQSALARHDAHLKIDSKLGQGSSFTLVLPVAHPAVTVKTGQTRAASEVRR